MVGHGDKECRIVMSNVRIWNRAVTWREAFATCAECCMAAEEQGRNGMYSWFKVAKWRLHWYSSMGATHSAPIEGLCAANKQRIAALLPRVKDIDVLLAVEGLCESLMCCSV